MRSLSEVLSYSDYQTLSSGPKALAKVLKLNFRDISMLDEVGEHYLHIEELILNHNKLTTLDGIEQFSSL